MIVQNNAQKSQDSHSFRIDKDSINFKQEYTYLDVSITASGKLH